MNDMRDGHSCPVNDGTVMGSRLLHAIIRGFLASNPGDRKEYYYWRIILNEG